ncbi:MAG: hypothetical protein EOL88_06410 [Bacteroidia bacterium]|nr:hypothetical protein [Bacteroidia bacterium]
MNKDTFLELTLAYIRRSVKMYYDVPMQRIALEKAFLALSSGKRWIWVCGTIGSGKTTVCNAIASVLPYTHTVKGINIREYEILKDIIQYKILFIDDIGKNPERINNMGDYINTIEYILHNRDKGITLFTSQFKFNPNNDYSLLDRAKEKMEIIEIKIPSLR